MLPNVPIFHPPDDRTPEEYEIYGNDRNRSRLFERYTEHCEHSDL